MILDEIVDDKIIRLQEQKRKMSETKMKELALLSTRKSISFYQAIEKKGLSIIGEFKKASPSLGTISSHISLEDRVLQYNQSVDAISCLTEEDHFHGSVEYLKQIRKISPLPILRKDFIIEEYQVYEAKVIGADAILLIVAILEDEKLKSLYELAYSLGLDVLMEVHTEEEMRRAMALRAKIIGVNNRDLRDFSISLQTSQRLIKILREQKEYRPLLVSESGVTSVEQIPFLRELGVHALLIGRAFMEAKEPMEFANQLKESYDQ